MRIRCVAGSGGESGAVGVKEPRQRLGDAGAIFQVTTSIGLPGTLLLQFGTVLDLLPVHLFEDRLDSLCVWVFGAECLGHCL